MNTLREAVHEYLSMRRNLGFKLRAAGTHCSTSSISWSSARHLSSPRHWHLPGRNNPRMSDPRIGRNGWATCGSLRVIARPQTRARRFHPLGCCPFGPSGKTVSVLG